MKKQPKQSLSPQQQWQQERNSGQYELKVMEDAINKKAGIKSTDHVQEPNIVKGGWF